MFNDFLCSIHPYGVMLTREPVNSYFCIIAGLLKPLVCGEVTMSGKVGLAALKIFLKILGGNVE